MRTIGIIAALAQEVAPFVAGLDAARRQTVGDFVIHQGEVLGRPVSLVVSGVGKKAAQNATAALIGFSRPGLIVSTGFAGGLAEELAAGTVVYSNRLVDDAGARETFDIPDGLAALPAATWGVVLTSRRFVSAVDHRRQLRERFGAAAVDMESVHVCRVARGSAIPVVVVRVISDDLSAELPVMGSVMKRDGRLDLGRAIPYFASHPKMIIPFVRFMGKLAGHADTLNGSLRRLISSLPAAP